MKDEVSEPESTRIISPEVEVHRIGEDPDRKVVSVHAGKYFKDIVQGKGVYLFISNNQNEVVVYKFITKAFHVCGECGQNENKKYE